MTVSTNAGYLMSGQVARLLGISKGTVLRAVAAGTLHAAYTMPSGALRFMPPDVERYAQCLTLKARLRAAPAKPPRRTQGRRDRGREASVGPPSGLQATSRAGTTPQVADLRQLQVAGLEQLSLLATGKTGAAHEDTTNILTLVADSLQVGATCLATVVDGTWQIAQLYDRAGMGLRLGGALPYSEVYGRSLADGSMQALIVEDLGLDARFAPLAVTSAWRAGAMTAVPLAWADGRPYGALCTFHPRARSVPGGEIPVLRLAGRMVMHAVETETMLARERQSAQQIARYAAMVEASDDAITSFDLAGRIESWNPSAVHLYGYSAHEVIGQSISLLAPPDRVDEVVRLKQEIARGSHIAHFDTVRRRKDGRLLDVSLTLSPIRDRSGVVVGVSAVARDITDRVRAQRMSEQARLAAEELQQVRDAAEALSATMRGVISSLAANIAVLDPAGRIVATNDAWDRFARENGASESGQWGVGADYLAVCRTASESGDVEARAALAGIQAVLDGADPLFTLEYPCPSLEVQRWFELSATSLASGRGGAVVSHTNITERKLAEQRLRFQATLLDAVGQAVVATDLQGSIRYWNHAAEVMYGWPASEVMGRNAGEVMIAPTSFEQGVQIVAAIGRGEAWSGEFQVRRRDGSTIPVLVTDTPIHDTDGTMVGIIGVSLDISARKQAERALERARVAAEELASLRQEQLEEAQAMSAVSTALSGTLEPHRLYQVILEQAERILHCDHTCVMLHMDGWATVAASRGVVAQPDGARLFALAAVDPVTVYGANYQSALVADTSAVRWLDVPPLVGAYAVRSAIVVPLVLDGIVVGSFNADSFTPKFYTEQHLARAVALGERVAQALRNVRLFQLEQQRTRTAEELASLKDDFVASVSHELRTPLTAMIGYAELLEARWTTLDDGRRREQIHKIVLAANRQHRVVEDLLLLSRLERRDLAPTPARVLVADLLRQAQDDVHGTYPDQGIDFDERCAVRALADPGRTTRVLVNLLDNAAKYSPVGSPITVNCTVETGMAVVRVRDYGPGIAEDGRDRLFTRFGRMAGSRTRAGHVGTGLGLYLSRSLVEEMGGDLDLEATGPEGSTFRLRLPALPTQAGAGTLNG